MLPAHSHQCVAYCATGRITRCPALAAARIRCVTVGTQRPAINEGIRQCVDHHVASSAQHGRDHGRTGYAHQQHVVQTHAIEAVLQRHDALDLVRLDHGGEQVLHEQRLCARDIAPAGKVIRDGEDASQVIRRVTPFSRQPGVVEIQPSDHRTDVERGLHRVQLMGSPGHPRAAGQHRSVHHWSQKPGAGRIPQRLEAASQRIHQAVERRFAGDG
jgi:hypothetical protein